MLDKRIKTPECFIIISVLIFVIIFFYFCLEESITIFYDVLVISIFFVIILLILILSMINNAIFYQKIRLTSKKHRLYIIKYYNLNIFKKIYRYFFNFYYRNNKSMIIDHGYDGIKELNNPIPNWWVNLFIFTIIFSFIYFISYIISDFSNPDNEYNIAYKKQMNQIAIYEKTIPQATINTAKFNFNYVSDGKKIFNEICSSCHNEDGSGNSGPNLTDDYWINIENKDKLFDNIFYIIWNGSKKNKIMRAFGVTGELKGNDIEKVASYVYSINKSKNKPVKHKEKQGVLYRDWKD
jgi:cytochrome c oxidase cbb3-type subunit 3